MYYCGVTWEQFCSQSSVTGLFVYEHGYSNLSRNIKGPYHRPFVRGVQLSRRQSNIWFSNGLALNSLSSLTQICITHLFSCVCKMDMYFLYHHGFSYASQCSIQADEYGNLAVLAARYMIYVWYTYRWHLSPQTRNGLMSPDIDVSLGCQPDCIIAINGGRMVYYGAITIGTKVRSYESNIIEFRMRCNKSFNIYQLSMFFQR